MGLQENAEVLPKNSARKKLSKAEIKRRKILDAAAKVFIERGYSGATLSEIAEEAGTQAGSLYYHFESREHLVREILGLSLRNIVDRVAVGLDALSPGASALDRIREAIIAHLNSILLEDDYTATYDRIIDEVPDDVRNEFLNQPRAYGQVWQKLITDAQDAGEIRQDLDPTVFRMLLFGAITRSKLWFDPNGRMTPTELGHEIFSVFFDGARNRQENNDAVANAKSRNRSRPSADKAHSGK